MIPHIFHIGKKRNKYIEEKEKEKKKGQRLVTKSRMSF